MRSHAKALVAALTLLVCLGVAQSAVADNPPTLSVQAASEVGFTAVKLNGEVNPEGGPSTTFWHFEISEGPEGAETWAQFDGGGTFEGAEAEETTPLSVQSTATNLRAGQTYLVRLVAENGESANHVESPGPYLSFTTAEATAPGLSLKAASAIAFTEADIAGEIDPEGGNVNPQGDAVPIFWQLQYAPASDPENWALAENVVVGPNPIEGAEAEANSGIEVKAHLSGLQNGTEYLYRLAASYAGHEATPAEGGTFTTEAVTAPGVTIDEPGSVTATTAHLSGHVDPNGADPAFDASWHFQCTPECPNLKGGVVEGSEDEVEADATGLEPNTSYAVKLIATNAGGTSEASEPFETAKAAPLVTTLGASAVSAGEATLNGSLNPQNDPTLYWFEWGSEDCASNPCQSIPASEDADGGSGGASVHVSRQLPGLSPETTYHFRLVAENSAGPTAGLDRTFTTTGAASSCPNAGALGTNQLPDCRAWEMASPPDKNGGDVMADTSRIRAGAEGSAIDFPSLSAFGDARGTGVAVDYIAERDPAAGANGWVTHAITPQQGNLSKAGATFAFDPFYVGELSPDLSTGVTQTFRPIGEAPNVKNVENLYLRKDLRSPGAGSYQLLSDAASPQPPSTKRPFIAGASADFGQVIFESTLNLTPATSGNRAKLYDSANGAVSLVGRFPDGSAAESSIAGAGAERLRETYRTISADGSRVFFVTDPETVNGYLGGKFYARVDAKVSVQLNASERTVPEGPQGAVFGTASVDGSRVFFTTGEGLVDSDNNHSQDLYMWAKQPGNERQQLTVDASGGTFALSLDGVSTAPLPAAASAAEVQAALAAIAPVGPGDVSVSGGPGDPGGSSPYAIEFLGALAGVDVAPLQADASALSGGAASATATITQPVRNLTLVSVDSAGPDIPDVQHALGASEDGRYVYFLAGKQLVPAEPQFAEGSAIYLWHDGSLSYVGWLTDNNDRTQDDVNAEWGFPRSASAVRVTPDGHHLLFLSRSDEGLVGRGGFPGYDQGNSCTYDVLSGRPCRELYAFDAETGRLQCASCNPTAPVAAGDARLAFREGTGGSINTSHQPHALSDDGRYVFFTTEDALVEGDTNGKYDAYVYDTLSGEPHLLSSGTEKSPSYFVDASVSGDDAFILTRQRLSGWDTDSNYDLYDARVDGGLPEPPATTAPCGGDSCKGSAAPAPSPASNASATFAGPGNLKSRPCPNGRRQVKAHGKSRCVKPKKHRKHRKQANANRRAGR